MNTFLWVLQGMLSFAMVGAGVMKLTMTREKLLPKLPWATDYSGGQIRLIGTAEFLGGIGVVVPWWTGILPVLTPLAAAGLALIMGGAIVVHVRRKESPSPAVVFEVLSIAVAVGRSGLVHM